MYYMDVAWLVLLWVIHVVLQREMNCARVIETFLSCVLPDPIPFWLLERH